jgi:WD40 repeat protein
LPRPRGILLAEISEHSESVTCLEKVADQFFLSGSSDGTLRVFDSKKIQMNMTVGSEACV